MRKFGFWRWFAWACCLGFLALMVAAWQVGSVLMAPANRSVASAKLDFPVFESMLDSESGARIAAWYAPADNARAASIILLHPVRTDRSAMLERARLFQRVGYAVVMIDFQAHGESSGRHVTFGHLERHDVRAAVAYAKRLNPRHRIGIVGSSLGGAAALLASPLDVDAVVLESVYTTIAEAVENRVSMRAGFLSPVLTPLLLWQFKPRLGIATSELRPIDHIANVEAPVLIAGGDLDRHTPIDQTRQLFEAAHHPKRFVVFNGAAHTDLFAYDPTQYEAEVLGFLDKYLMIGSE